MQTIQTIWDSTIWNPEERRLRALWRLVLHYALWVFVGVVLFRFLGAPLSALISWLMPDATVLSDQIVRFSLRLVAALLSTWVAARYVDRRLFRDLGLYLDGRWWYDLAFGLVLGALLMTLIFTLEYSLGWVEIRERYAVSPAASVPFFVALIGPLVAFVVVGISEEILSRGYQLRNMAEGFNFGRRHSAVALLLAWLLSSAIFGLLHAMNPNATWISTANLMLAGLFLGLGLILTGRLGLPIGLHISWNFFQGNVFGFPVSGVDYAAATFLAIQQGGPELWTGGAFGPEAGLIGIAAICLGCLLTVLWVRVHYGRVALYQSYAVYVPPTPPGPPQDAFADGVQDAQHLQVEDG